MGNNELGHETQKTESTSIAYIVLIIGILGVAFSAPWVKLSNFEPATSVILRVGIGALALLPFYIRELKKLGSLNKEGIILSLFAGLFLGIDFTAWNYSIYYVGSGIASILLNLQIIILPALAALFDKERIPKSFYVIAPIMIIGVMMSGGIFDPADVTTGNEPTVLGMSLAVFGTIAGSISGICYGIYLYTSRKATRVNVGQIVQPMFYASIAQLLAPFIFLLATGRGMNFTEGVLVKETDGRDMVLPTEGLTELDIFSTMGEAITGMNWVWMIVLAIFGQAIAWTFIQYGSVRLNPTIVAGLLILSPIATVGVIAVVMFGEIPSLIQVLGVVVVLLAVAYQNGLHKMFSRSKG